MKTSLDLDSDSPQIYEEIGEIARLLVLLRFSVEDSLECNGNQSSRPREIEDTVTDEKLQRSDIY